MTEQFTLKRPDFIFELNDHFGKKQFYRDKKLPVNNFLKDFSEIEKELKTEFCKDSTQFMTLDGKLVPVEQVLASQMEENY